MARKFKSMDGNEAAAWVSYAYTEVASIYPITPSSPMADHVDQWAAQGLKNIFGTSVKIQEMESEAGAAGAVHGSLGAGALTTSYTASQGLLLMIPNMYKMAGEGLPNVLHVSARTVATQALNIFGDHSDVMACRQTGYAMLAEGNVQEVMDLSPVAHLAAIEGSVPFLNFFDGFRTSHEIQKVAVWDFNDLADMVDMDAVQAFRDHALNPEHPTARGSHENGDVFFQHREACNGAYNALPAIVQGYMDKINEKLGTSYHLFDYYGAPDVAEAGIEGLTVIGGRYGLGSKDEPPAAAFAVYEELAKDEPKREFTIGIVDDVTNLSLPMDPNAPGTAAPGTIECKFWGLGGDGTVGANKNSIKIIGDHTDKYVQAYFQYDSKKTGGVTVSHLRFGDSPIRSPYYVTKAIKIIGDHTDKYVQAYFQYDSKKTGGVTVSHLRFGDSPIRSPYYVTKADFVACHNPSYIIKGFKMVRDVKPGGTFLVNCQWSDEEFAEHLPAEAKRYIAKNDVNVYLIDAIDLAEQVGMGKRTNTVLQSAFFALADILPAEEALQYMKDAATKSYSKKGDAVVAANHKAIDAGATAFRKFEVPADWADATDVPEEDDLKGREAIVKQVRELLGPINRMDGDSLPVSAFMDHVDGAFELGASAYEKRGTAVMVPRWDPEQCIQCNNCAYVCPHAAIRPIVMDAEEQANAPEAMKTLDLRVPKGTGYTFTVAVSPLDCMGCYNCLSACPKSTQKDGGALTMVPQAEEAAQVPVWDYAVNEVSEKRELFSDKNTRGSQFSMPLLEFSGSCAGCAETSYARLITQLFGDRMFISNATGCSSIWGNPAATSPFTCNAAGHGPAWNNSLFEDNAEHGMGLLIGYEAEQNRLAAQTEKLLEVEGLPEGLKKAASDWLENKNTTGVSQQVSADYAAELVKSDNALAEDIAANKCYLSKKSCWIFGGDGWAYDIGFGGLDHVLASGKNVNVFVFDTEVYSNTGGQASKASRLGQVAQFAAEGKSVEKKPLAEMMMSYGYVYVAQVAMGANPQQLLKALAEAEAYDGPSLIIGYSPCEMHSIKKGGMLHCQEEQKRAVECGYWNLFRFNPAAPAGKKFSLDENEQAAMDRYDHLLKLKDMYDNEGNNE